MIHRAVLIGLLLVAVMAPGLAGATFTFPSASSVAIGSPGSLDANQVGYFWSVNRGDSVLETFADSLVSVGSMKLNLFVVENVLSPGAFVNWDVELNGAAVGNFTVNDGFTGALNISFLFPSVLNVGGNYTVGLYVTNEVAGGDGSHTFGRGSYPSTVELGEGSTVVPEPSTWLLAAAGIGMLGALRRRR